MKHLEDTKHCQLLLLNGKDKLSLRVYHYEKEKVSIRSYTALYWDGHPEHGTINISEKTEHTICVLLNKKQERAHVSCLLEEKGTPGQNDVQRRMDMPGIFILMWEESIGINTFNFLWIDNKDGHCKTISLESYGYKSNDIMALFHKVFMAMSHGISQFKDQELLMADQPTDTL